MPENVPDHPSPMETRRVDGGVEARPRMSPKLRALSWFTAAVWGAMFLLHALDGRSWTAAVYGASALFHVGLAHLPGRWFRVDGDGMRWPLRRAWSWDGVDHVITPGRWDRTSSAW